MLHDSLLGDVAKVNSSTWRCFSFLIASLMSAFIDSVLVPTSRIHLPQNYPGLLGHIRVSANENLGISNLSIEGLLESSFFLKTRPISSNEQFSLMLASLFF